MKTLLLLLFIAPLAAFTQSTVTTQQLKKIKSDIDKDVIKFSKNLKSSNVDFSKYALQFSVDTFKIERELSKKIEINYSTIGMSGAMEDAKIQYDNLLGKYYNLLISKLSLTDKNILIASERAWISFRDNEIKFMANFYLNDKYSGGGTIQSTFLGDNVLELYRHRAVSIYNYYGTLMENSQTK